jgi:hypothetical protein
MHKFIILNIKYKKVKNNMKKSKLIVKWFLKNLKIIKIKLGYILAKHKKKTQK